MPGLWDHARSIAEPLADSLAALEARDSGANVDRVRASIVTAWISVIDDAEGGNAMLHGRYLAGVHGRMAVAVGANVGAWEESGRPPMADGRPTSWGEYVDACGDGAGERVEEGWILAQLRWGGHVRNLALPLGWIAMNIARFLNGQWAIYPPPGDHDWLIDVLKGAGPDAYDAEGLRACIWNYSQAQNPWA
jgi:hypothetical protein